jgi:hypothetical protein
MIEGRVAESPTGPRALVLAALHRVAGTPRTLIYAVPSSGAPHRTGTVHTGGSREWWEFVRERRLHDTGEFTLVLALRALSSEEARLILDWGSRFANAFLLVEPRDPSFDITTDEGLQRFLEGVSLHGDEERLAEGLEDALRRIYGRWVYWPSPASYTQEPVRTTLDLVSPPRTIALALEVEVEAAFPPQVFEPVLEELVEREEELFQAIGPVARSVIPFFSRLGLPIPYNQRLITRAFRKLVNLGRLWVREPGPDGAFYRGPRNPVPDTMSDEEFEGLVR